jgi:fucokinase
MMDVIEDDVYGQSLAGAGGGGFAYVISKQPHQSDVLEAKIRAALGEAVAEVKFHKVEVDAQGLTVTKVPV